jgi:hypothetical protein
VSKQNEILARIDYNLVQTMASAHESSRNLIAAVNGVTDAIHKLTLQIQEIQKMLDPAKLSTLFGLVTQLLQTVSTDSAQITSLQQQIATLTEQDAALNDPALETQLESLIAAASAAEPPAGGGGTGGGTGTGTTVAPFDPTVNYQPGQEVQNPDGSIWTAVTPVLGEAPGVTAGNWTENASLKKVQKPVAAKH